MKYKCGVCSETVEGDLITFTEHTNVHIIDAIKEKNPDWADEDGLCERCAEYFKKQIRG